MNNDIVDSIGYALMKGSVSKHTNARFYEGKFWKRIICAILGHNFFMQRIQVHPNDSFKKFDIGCKRCGQLCIMEVYEDKQFPGLDSLIYTGYSIRNR